MDLLITVFIISCVVLAFGISCFALWKITKYTQSCQHLAKSFQGIQKGGKQMLIVEVVDPSTFFYWRKNQ